MPGFDKNNIGELKEFIYKSCPHDATVENVKCSCKGNSIEIELYNTFFNVGMNLIFRNVEIALAVKGKEYGSSETILSLTVEEDFTYLKKYLSDCDESVDSNLYLLFQMFSGDELHIVSKEVIIEIAE